MPRSNTSTSSRIEDSRGSSPVDFDYMEINVGLRFVLNLAFLSWCAIRHRRRLGGTDSPWRNTEQRFSYCRKSLLSTNVDFGRRLGAVAG
jgi:hypothetical protein